MIDPCASSTPSRFVLFLSSVLILDVGRLVLPPFSDQISYNRTTRVSEGGAQAAPRDSHHVWFVLLSLDCSRLCLRSESTSAMLSRRPLEEPRSKVGSSGPNSAEKRCRFLAEESASFLLSLDVRPWFQWSRVSNENVDRGEASKKPVNRVRPFPDVSLLRVARPSCPAAFNQTHSYVPGVNRLLYMPTPISTSISSSSA